MLKEVIIVLISILVFSYKRLYFILIFVLEVHLIRIQDAKPQEATATSIELCPNNNEEYVTLLDFGLFDDIEFGILYTYGGGMLYKQSYFLFLERTIWL